MDVFTAIAFWYGLCFGFLLGTIFVVPLVWWAIKIIRTGKKPGEKED